MAFSGANVPVQQRAAQRTVRSNDDQAKHIAIADYGKKFTERLIRLNAQKQ